MRGPSSHSSSMLRRVALLAGLLSARALLAPTTVARRLTGPPVSVRRAGRRATVIRACYACSRGALFTLWDGSVVAQAPPAEEKFRKDYKLSPYRINRLSLEFDIRETETLVTSTMKIVQAIEEKGAANV